MSKIYQTPEDLQREKLGKEIEDAKTTRNNSIWDGVSVSLLGLILSNSNRLRQFEADTLKQTRSGFEKWSGKSLPWIAGAVGAASFIMAFVMHRSAKKSEAELAKIGPEQVVLPNDGMPCALLPAAIEGAHVSRLQKTCDVPHTLKSL